MKKIKINPNLSLLLSGQLISQIGDKFYALALAYWVLQTTGSPSLTGLVLFFSMAPAIITGLFSGGIIDFFNRKKLMVNIDIIRGLVVSIVAISYYAGALNMPIIITAQVILSICSAFFDPTVQAVIPQIVEKGELISANARSQFVSGVSLVVGPLLGGICAAWLGYGFIFSFNAFSFFVAAFLAASLVIKPVTYTEPSKKKIRENIQEGYKYIFKNRSIILIVTVVAILHFFVGSVQVIMPVFALTLKGNGAQNLGIIESFYGTGVIVTGFILSLTSINGQEKKYMYGGIGFIGLVYMVFGILSNSGVDEVLPYFFIFFAMSSAVVVISTCYRAILQQMVENEMSGRVFGIIGAVGNFTYPVAMLLFGIMLEWFKYGLLLMFCGSIVIVLGLALFKLNRKSIEASS
ncbi:MFS transporter [Paenibacillus riograndensis]|uniref:Major facilitator superfamily protein n=3 Tax=Paenibacillus riograndensis TaxID=483937 RepID=A0A0E3WGE4_9BACL|nr:MFS transporter [Paenibacillus riograndensis]CQR52701.1 major facilitator superfamily protein [Paenibacillus riograndensis SBR5]